MSPQIGPWSTKFKKYRDYLSRQVVFRFTFDVVLLKAQREMAKIADIDENCRF